MAVPEQRQFFFERATSFDHAREPPALHRRELIAIGALAHLLFALQPRDGFFIAGNARAASGLLLLRRWLAHDVAAKIES